MVKIVSDPRVQHLGQRSCQNEVYLEQMSEENEKLDNRSAIDAKTCQKVKQNIEKNSI